MDLLETLDTARDVFSSVISSMGSIGQEATGEGAEENSATPIDFNAFNDLFSNILQENGVIGKKDNLNLNDSEESADKVNDSGNLLEDMLVGVASSLLFNNIDTDKNKMLDLEEQNNFSSFINDVYNMAGQPSSADEEETEEPLTDNLDTEA